MEGMAPMPSKTDDARMAAMPAAASLPRRAFTRGDYHAMGKAGILTPEDRVELLEGEVIVMSPIGTRHAACVDRLTRAFYSAGPIAGRALVRVQNPLAVSHRSELQPDLMLLVQRDDDYAFEHPEPADVLLLVEVADSSIDYDRRTKTPAYARAGVSEVWLVDLAHNRIEACSEPTPDGYRVTRRHGLGESLSPTALPDLTLEIDQVIPPRRPAD